ncbi:MAG: hypothetical protein B7X90_04920 [Novosphingobium sp. 17-62-19]|uniref:hypothetical protein n=1 Tax=Novosphingobium sp. 17-62-19 TaxID=1970406 RepID=UPI000BD8B172|nr:hypothetical protein [Novosphingobium sp. 17-62-19]OZA20758.1 MAG: hypothetical protein B7X90_04920 [Novosphingobium sp. 17-62-19]
MVAWFIIAIATLGVFAFIAVNGVQTVAATTDGVGRVETARRLDAAVAALIARAGSPSGSGRMVLLAGQTVDGVYGLPAELAMFATTPFGQRIVYCPFGDGESGTAAGAVPLGAGASYPIRTQADPAGRLYVTDGRPALAQVAENGNLMGYLIAPRTKTSPTPTCSSVRFNAGTRRFEAPDAYVRAIIRASSTEDQRQQAGREVVFFVSPSGTGRGLAPNDATTLYNAMTYYRANSPQAMRIVLAAGNYVLPAQYMNYRTGSIFGDKGNSGTLVLDGAGSTNISFENDPSGTRNFILVPGNLELRNLSVSTAVHIYADAGRKLTMKNVNSGNILAQNGATLLTENVYVVDGQNTWAIVLNAGAKATFRGTLTIDTTLAGHALLAQSGSQAAFESAAVTARASNTTGNIAVYIEEGADMVWRAGSYTVAKEYNYPILVHGHLTMYNTNITMTTAMQRGIEVQRTGKVGLNDLTVGLGVAPIWGLVDVGSSGVTGNATLRAVSNCWTNAGYATGVQFILSGDGAQNGASSAVTANEALPAMSASPTAAEVQANADANARNTMRQQIRSTNTSTFTCLKG